MAARPLARYSVAVSRRPVKAGGMGFFDDLPASEPAPARRRPAFGIAESRAGIDAQIILDAARRSVRLWPENEG
jgi:hypothetical protein